MNFGGIQKFTLLDYPDKTACTLFVIGCNFCCPYCHNASLIALDSGERAINASDVLDYLKTRKGLLDGVCISGGEPMFCDPGNEISRYNELEDFIYEVKSMGFLIKLDTNGSYPRILEKVIAAGNIDYIAMDIKNTPEKYAKTIGVPDYDISPVQESIDLLQKYPIPHEFRTTVVREFHTKSDLLAIALWISGAKYFFLQKFIGSDNVLQSGLSGYSDTEMTDFLIEIKKIIPDAEMRGV